VSRTPQKSRRSDNSIGNAQQNAATKAEAPSKSQSDDNELRRRIEDLEKALAGRKRRKKTAGPVSPQTLTQCGKRDYPVSCLTAL
jgi:hypothetical protein